MHPILTSLIPNIKFKRNKTTSSVNKTVLYQQNLTIISLYNREEQLSIWMVSNDAMDQPYVCV